MRKRGYRNCFVGLVLAAVALAASVSPALATHLRAGQITVQHPDCSSLTFVITITVYTNTGSSIRFGDGLLDFGDGSKPFVTPTRENTPFDPAENIGIVTFSYTYTFAGPGRYTISYFEHNRNADILNMSNSVDTPFYIYTVIDIDPLKKCDNSPVLTVPPIDKACSGTAFFHNPGAYDPDGDSLSYVLVPPKQDGLHDVNNYSDPNAAPFYAGLNYSAANEAMNGAPTFSINAVTGLITWDAPGRKGEYNIAFHIIEWRKLNNVWIQLGYVTRDMQIIVEDCSNKRPDLIVPQDTCVVAGTVIDKEIFGTDPNFDSVKLEAFSQIFSLNPPTSSLNPDPARFEPTAIGVDAILKFHWATQCAFIKEQPYQVVFKVTDKPKANTGGVALVAFKTWNITVVGPAPKWTSVQSQPGRKAKLVWEPYECSTQATTMQIWRRVESNPYDPPPCVTGMPPSLGFTMIDVVPIATTQYIDTNGGRGLAAGAQYCYRLVAVFQQPTGGLSYVSKEECFTTLINAPVITNVSIDITNMPVDPVNGEDTVKWLAPIKANVDASLPPPYSYIVYRAEGEDGTFTQVNPGKIDTTFFIDRTIDTNEKIFTYKVSAYSSNGNVIDTSATASTVRLTLKPHATSIDLSWAADVPWSNILATHPLHYVYRGPQGSTKLSDMTLLATVDVTKQNLRYTDAGPLDKTQTYCYCVQTEGGYGNPLIKEPLTNFSQITCIQPSDTIPPCAVVINAKATDCSQVYAHSCSATAFSNVLTWNRPTSDCQEEAFIYTVYAAARTGGTFTTRATNIIDTFFVDNSLASFAQCYKVSATSRSGIESALSQAFCFDNCPHYELPNVFTPDNDQCNDMFSAFSDRERSDTNTTGYQISCTVQSEASRYAQCARFVNSVNFTVYNRWGKEVYTYQSGGENSIYIDWNGKDDQGKDLSAGIYYYLAEVNFDVVDPRQQNKNIKGWVQIVR